MENKTCPICQTVFKKPPRASRKEWASRFCCSMSCAAKYRGSPWLDRFKIKKGEHLSSKTQFKKGEQKKDKNVNWKGSDVGYYALHQWIKYNYGSPSFCEECKCSNRQMYHWANLSGKYLRDRNDWKRMCVPCHKRFDMN